jgi:hypothetical protein
MRIGALRDLMPGLTQPGSPRSGVDWSEARIERRLTDAAGRTAVARRLRRLAAERKDDPGPGA